MPLTHCQLTEQFIDRADRKVKPRHDVTLELLPEPAPGWVHWPGRWGDTQKPSEGPKTYREISSGSRPGGGERNTGPIPRRCSKRRKIRDARRAGPHLPAAPPRPSRPSVRPRREDGRLQLGYELAPAPASSSRLICSSR